MSQLIGAFPDPYPGELLSSIIARYMERLDDWRVANTCRELFGTSQVPFCNFFPCRLSTLAERLPSEAFALSPANGRDVTGRWLLQEHTLFPYFAPFLPPQRFDEIERDILDSPRASLARRVGIGTGPIRFPLWLRYCPVCVQDDRSQYGEPYWHREHQLPGSLVCSRHLVWLEYSHVRALGQKELMLAPASHVLDEMPTARRVRSTPAHDVLIRLSQATDILLTCYGRPLGLDALRAVYWQSLKADGLTRTDDEIHFKILIERLRSTYSPGLLRLLRCEIPLNPLDARSGRDYWLGRLLRRHSDRARPPLHHLLVQDLLGLHVEDVVAPVGAIDPASDNRPVSLFGEDRLRPLGACTGAEQLPSFRTSYPLEQPHERGGDTDVAQKQNEPFGTGPWPCLNPACSAYHRLVITSCRITWPGGHGPRARVHGIFACSCGFEYLRIGPDFSLEGRFRCGRVLTFGAVWEQRLRELWNNTEVEIQAIASHLHVFTSTLKYQASQLGLPLQRVCHGRMRTLTPGTAPGSLGPVDLSLSEYTRHRASWAALVQEHPHFSWQRLQKENYNLYAWLLRHDSAWLCDHLPATTMPGGRAVRIDWYQRDLDLVEAIGRLIPDFTGVTGPNPRKPIRITRGLIGRRTGSRLQLQTKLHQLPQTADLLNKVCESWYDFAIRRIRWAVSQYLHEGKVPTRTQFIQRAALQTHMSQTRAQNLAAEVSQALHDLENTLNTQVIPSGVD